MPGKNEGNVLYYYRARYYEPGVARFTSEDPAQFMAGIDFYIYAGDNPIIYKDPTGLKILYCSRPAEHMPGNHGFLYDTRNGDNCGKGSGNHPHGHDNPGNLNTFCVEVPGSEGHEDEIMKCCRDKSASFWGRDIFVPWGHDCQTLAGDCLTEKGFKNPGAPGGRLGCRGNCKGLLNLAQPIVVPRH